jgi:hypothetical protein
VNEPGLKEGPLVMVGKVGAYQGQKIFENPREALTHAQVTSRERINQ